MHHLCISGKDDIQDVHAAHLDMFVTGVNGTSAPHNIKQDSS